MFSFDRAAGYYDATRALPDEVGAELVDVLAAELLPVTGPDGKGPCLEIGIGTGRIALPLLRRGVSMLGTDIAEAMLEKLAQNAQNAQNPGLAEVGPPVPVVLGDATALPFGDGSVGAVVASHVLHLIPNWRVATDEAMRVLRSHAPFLVDFGGAPRAPWHEWAMEVFRGCGIERVRPGVSRPEEVSSHLGDRATARPLRSVRLAVRRALGQDLDEWERQIHSWTWPYSAEQIRAACAEVRVRAPGEGWSPDDVVDMERTIQWWAFERAG